MRSPLALSIIALLSLTLPLTAQRTGLRFDVEETTIAEIHAAMKAGRLTCQALVAEYLQRIEAFDKKGPAFNAIVQINPDAAKEAADLDRRFKAAGPGRAPALHSGDREGQLRNDSVCRAPPARWR